MIGLFRSSQEEFLRCDGEQGSALRGGFLSARAERNQRAAKGWAQDGHSRAHIRPPPGPPFYGGRQLGSLGGHRKGAGGQRIGFRSMTAAAEFPVTFGWYPYRLEARLLGWWGSSSAPFGLVGLKFGLEGRRAGEGTRPYGGYGNRCIFHVGPGILIGPFPGGPVCRPYEKKHPGFSLGAGHWPARR